MSFFSPDPNAALRFALGLTKTRVVPTRVKVDVTHLGGKPEFVDAIVGLMRGPACEFSIPTHHCALDLGHETPHQMVQTDATR